tara:strand:+ start:1225 stop:2508 length:1284 start_codon:yes stop_codon:yes gene_type:complete
MAQYGEVRVDFITYTTGVAPNEGNVTVTVSSLTDKTTVTGGLTVSGDLTVTGDTRLDGNLVVLSGITTTSGIFASGTASNPSVTFTGDVDTGLYSPLPNELGITVGGNARAIISTTGAAFGGNGALTIPIGTSGQRPTAVEGMIRINTESNVFEGYRSGAWRDITDIPGANLNPTFNTVIVQNTLTVTGDAVFGSDVNITGTLNADDITATGTISGAIVTATGIYGTTITGTNVRATSITGTAISGLTVSGGTILNTTLHTTTGFISSGIFGSGTAAAPSITFTGDINTGIYTAEGGNINFTTSGVERVSISESGVITAKNGAVAEIANLAWSATPTPDFASSCNFNLVLSGGTTLGNPTNATPGQTGSIFVIQDGTGSHSFAYASNWDFINGSGFAVSGTANSVSRLDYIVRTATSIHCVGTGPYS